MPRATSAAPARMPSTGAARRTADDDRVLALGADGDHRDWRRGELLETRDVALCIRGKLADRTRGRERRRPARHLLVLGNGGVEESRARRDAREALAVGAIGGADAQRIHAGQHVELGERDAGETVEARRLPHEHGVAPPATSRPARRGTELVAALAQALADRATLFGGKRPIA